MTSAARGAWPAVLLAVAGCVDTAVDVLQRADAAEESDVFADEGTSDGSDDGAPDASDDGVSDTPDGDAEAGGCRPGTPGDCPSGHRCDVRSCEPGATGTCLASAGACLPSWDPVCACDGSTYWNDCERLVSGAAWSGDGACDATPCSLWLGDTCDTGEICAVTGCSPLTLGTCAVRPGACRSGGAPTCGCDGADYSDACAALDADVAIDHAGACTALPCTPVCETVGADTAWRDPCTDTTYCTADCAGCAATCLLGGTGMPGEGWYSLCDDLARDGGCGDVPNVVIWQPCAY